MPYKVIVAHNSPTVLRAIRMAFSEREYEIYDFKDGVEVMQELNQINPDAILLSLSLHQEEGYEIGRYLKSQDKFKQIPLVLLHGAFETLNEEKAEGLVFDVLVQEPFDSEQLVRIVFDLIEKRKGPQTLPEEPSYDDLPSPVGKVELDEKVKEYVQKEILEVERELEKRIRLRVLTDLKDYVDKK
ncbi:MAG: response regulator [Candidatus Aminicenantes bacterium]|nr:response regulator [Candidatus Aminicenantes bacterium]